MDTKPRPSGIEELGDLSWGTHFCLFYETKEDLLQFFIPFFKAGLEHNEFCLCVASEPLIVEEAKRAMRQAFPEFGHYLAQGQLEITPHTDWYLKEGHFDEVRVLQGWIDKLDQALAKGFSGVRFAVNILLDKSEWESFAQYEGKLEETLHDLPITGLCAYNLNRHTAANLLDVLRHHQFSLARRDGAWEPLEGINLKRAHEKVLKLNNELEQRVAERTAELALANARLKKEITERKRIENALRDSEKLLQLVLATLPVGVAVTDLAGNFIIANPASKRIWGDTIISGSERWARSIGFWHDSGKRIAPEEWASMRALIHGETSLNELIDIETFDGGRKTIQNSSAPIRDSEGIIVGAVIVNEDVTERERAEEETKRQAARADTLARIAARLNKQLDLEAVIHAVCQEAVDTFKVSQAVISLYDKKRDLLDYAGGVNIPPQYAAKIEPVSRTQFEEFVRTMGPILVVPDIQALPNVPSAEFTFEMNVRTVVTADMLRDQELVGVLVLGVNEHVREFDQDELSLLKAISDQAAQAIANAKLFEQAEGARERLKALSRRLMEVQETERRALTAELHDRVGQNLTGLSINLQNLKASLFPDEAQALATKFDDAQVLVEDTTRQIRDIMAELHLPELEDYGLAAALETYAERAAARGNLELIVDLPDLASPPLPSNVRIALFRSAQEAISNVLKHSDATQLEIGLEERNGRLRLKIEDDGQGFESDMVSQRERQTLGLQIMHERIESIGGNIQIESRPGQGTQVVFEIERPS